MRRIRAFFRKLGNGLAHFFTHWSVKKVILLVLLAFVLWLIVPFVTKLLGFGRAVPAAGQNVTRTTVLEKSTLKNSITVTGTVQSIGVTNVTSTSSYKVSEVLVQAGDKVTAGQVLARLDTTDLSEEIAKKQATLADTIASAQRNYDRAVTARDEAHTASVNEEGSVEKARAAYQALEPRYNTAKAAIASAQSAYDAALAAEQETGAKVANIEGLQAAMVNAQKAMQDAAAAQAAAQTAYDQNQNADTQRVLDEAKRNTQAAQTAQDAATKAYNDTTAATGSLDSLRQDYTNKVQLRTNAEAALNAAKNTAGFPALERDFTAAQAAYSTARTNLDRLESTYKTAVQAVEDAAERLKTAKKSDELDALAKKLEECVITAPTGGTITTVNAVVGSYVTSGAATGGTALFVIQDTDHLKVGITINEYDIKKITTGQRAILRSDATGDKEIEGSVSQISLTATSGQSSSGFGAEVSVSGTDSGLLIGMHAKVEIVISEKKDVFAVPADAVGTDASGNSIVYVKDGDAFKPVTVTKGMETDYLVEIESGALRAGMELRATADESIIDNVQAQQEKDQEDPFGMKGGSVVEAAPAGGPPAGGGGRS